MTNLNGTFGAMLLGVLFTAVMYGVTSVQTYFYYVNYPKDARIYKLMVAALWCFDTSHVCLSWHMIYFYLVDNFNNNAELANSIWSFNVSVVITCCITAIVHVFYARRVWILSGRSYLLVGFILLMSLSRVVFGIVVTIYLFHLKQFEKFRSIDPFVATALSSGALADITITLSLCYYLQTTRSEFQRTNNVIDKLMIYTVNSGAFTSVFGILVVITFAASKKSLIFLAIHLMLSKLYSNAALASLNTRISLRGKGVDQSGTSQMTSGSRVSTSGSRSNGRGGAPVVRVVTTTMDDRSVEMIPERMSYGKYGQNVAFAPSPTNDAF